MTKPSLFSSVPEDIVNRILARLPKCYHPMILCLSKEFGHLIRSPEIQKIRSALSKDSIFVCYSDNPVSDRVQRVQTLDARGYTELGTSTSSNREHGREAWCSIALDSKVCALRSILEDIPNCYNTGDGSCDFIREPNDDLWGSAAACVIQNLFPQYGSSLGMTKRRLHGRRFAD
ncbi:hypothetical protein F2Q69_00001722 [Brassica cretica]|uniref:F-box domain-containing protein n=1 Tax=Brassica cretica TaxID=69181 RepID=A0A8S9P553_BRACR|nr:hypothetical protein F2Q69_00001722 [Brassica cretica]